MIRQPSKAQRPRSILIYNNRLSFAATVQQCDCCSFRRTPSHCLSFNRSHRATGHPTTSALVHLRWRFFESGRHFSRLPSDLRLFGAWSGVCLCWTL